MARPCRRYCHSLFEDERLLDIAVEPEAVRLEIGAVLAGREQMHSNVMCAVAGHWKIERFRKPRNLHKGCDAAAIGDIGLGIRHCTSRNVVLELPERSQVFARGNRYAAGGQDAGVTRNIVRNNRLLKPG